MRAKRYNQTSCQSCEVLRFLTKGQQWWRGRPWYQRATIAQSNPGVGAAMAWFSGTVWFHHRTSHHYCRLAMRFHAPPFTDGAAFGLTLSSWNSVTEVLLCSQVSASLFTFNLHFHWITRSPWNYGQFNIDIIPAKNNALKEFERRFHGDGLALAVCSRDQRITWPNQGWSSV